MKYRISLVLVVLVAFLAGCIGKSIEGSASSGNKRKYITLAANPSTSPQYAYWVSVGKAISTVYPEFQITVSESQGAVDISKRLRSGAATFGNCTAPGDHNDYFGQGPFDGDPNKDIRLLWFYDTTPFHIAVSTESGITNLSGLKGQKYNPGATGMDSSLCMNRIFTMFDLGINIFEASQADAADAYANKQIIGTTKSGPMGDSYVIQLQAARPIRLLSLSQDEVRRIITDMPYLAAFTIPAGTFDFIDHDVSTITMYQGAKTNTKLSQEDGYKMIKAMCEDGRDVWASGYPSGAKFDIVQLALDYSEIPLHGGTVQYAKEKGYNVPTNLIPPEFRE